MRKHMRLRRIFFHVFFSYKLKMINMSLIGTKNKHLSDSKCQ